MMTKRDIVIGEELMAFYNGMDIQTQPKQQQIPILRIPEITKQPQSMNMDILSDLEMIDNDNLSGFGSDIDLNDDDNKDNDEEDVWTEHIDKETGNTFWFNQKTEKSQWENPYKINDDDDEEEEEEDDEEDEDEDDDLTQNQIKDGDD